MFRFKLLAVASLLSAISMTSSSQTIKTIAGGGTHQPSQSTIGTQVSFCSITAITRDPSSGTIYFADYGCNGGAVVYKLSGDLLFSVVAGNGSRGYSGDGGAATSASFGMWIAGLAVAPSGNIYISDTYNNVVRKITVSTGIISTYAGGSASSYGNNEPALSTPLGLAVNSSTLYIAANDRVRKVVAGSTAVTTIAGNGTAAFSGDGGSAKNAQFTNAWSLALDTAGDLYIGDIGNFTSDNYHVNCRIRKITASTGIISTFAGDQYCGYLGDGIQATTAQLTYPKGLDVDSSGNVYIADGDQIRLVTSAGIIRTIAGQAGEGFSGDGGVPTSALLNGAQGVAVAGSAYYIADTGNARIRKVQ